MAVPKTVEKMEQGLVTLGAAGMRIKELEVEMQVLKNALWKACGDNADMANEYIESQR